MNELRKILLLNFMFLHTLRTRGSRFGFYVALNISGHYSEHEKSDKFCSEALISAWGSFTCRKSTTWDPRLYFPSKGSHIQDFYALKKSIDTEPANLGSSGEYDNQGRLNHL